MKKVLSIIMCMSLFIMWTLPVSAAEVISKENIIEKEDVSATSGSNSFSRTLSKLALMNGTATFLSGSISSNAQVTSISLYVRASSGEFSGYYLYTSSRWNNTKRCYYTKRNYNI